ncbi:MAG: nucleoside deaminase [Tissierellia bacterium]|jgi:tRNA(adenine34) deaminase|nr:nucleoside deaminase [Tissierellia bacterium]
MKEALIEAEKSYKLNEVPVGCVVVHEGVIIGRGYNLKETMKDVTYHAELLAIQEAQENLNHWWLENCDVYVTLEPCSMCAGAMLNARIRNLYVGARDFRMGATGSAIDLSNIESFNHHFLVTFGIMETECSEILSKFFKNLRKKNKTFKGF